MYYFAGIFDADGHVTLSKMGKAIVGLEKSTPEIPNLLQKTFGGHIYRPRSKSGRPRYYWRIAHHVQDVLRFINAIEPFSKIKQPQIKKLREYLDKPREERRRIRAECITHLSHLKKPSSTTIEQLRSIPFIQSPDQSFFKWMAGFMDGDGNFCVFEYDDRSYRRFDSWIGVFNTFPEPIKYIQEHIPGSISMYHRKTFPVFKWVASQSASLNLCDNILPYLIVRKKQCILMIEYLKIHNAKKYGVAHPEDTVRRIREIIKQIKQHNSFTFAQVALGVSP